MMGLFPFHSKPFEFENWAVFALYGVKGLPEDRRPRPPAGGAGR